MDCPNQRTLTIREVGEIQTIEEKASEEDFQDEDHTLITPDVGVRLIIRRVLHAKEAPFAFSQKEQIFHTCYTIVGKAFKLINDRVTCTNVTPPLNMHYY